MIRLVRAEWTKLFTTRVWLGLLLGACLMVAGFSALLTAFAGSSQNGQPGLPPVGDPRFEQMAFAVSTNASVLFLILGIIGMTQE
ncbi:MAG TPA: ABC transporter permease, partial [Blastococcus sp.]